MKQLEQDVARLQTEKDSLVLKLHDAKTSNASSKVSEQRRKRLMDLEADLSQLRKKITEQSKLLKVKEQTDKQCNKLGQEIQVNCDEFLCISYFYMAGIQGE
jgi:kinesin family protein 4/21/27